MQDGQQQHADRPGEVERGRRPGQDRGRVAQVGAPHREYEIYVVQAGAATLVTDSGTAEVGPGSVIFVPAGEHHRFTDVRGDLALLVIFAPPYGSRADVENP